MAGEPSSPAKRSFLDLFNNSPSVAPMFLKDSSFHRGEPALKYSNEEIQSLAAPLKYALVGKFTRGRPSMEALRKSFAKIDLKGSVKLGLIDKRHILIRAENEEDFLRFRIRKFWSFDGFAMRVFKWTPDFRSDIESSLVPVWVSFESLPLFMFNKASLFSLARILGVPLKIDAATSDLSRPSVARVCVELDLRKDMPKRLWLEIGTVGFWQSIHYEDLPKYCFDCSKIGHLAAECGHPNAVPQNVDVAVAPSLPKQKWILKTQQLIPPAANIVPSSNTQIAGVSNVVEQVPSSNTCPATAEMQSLTDSPSPVTMESPAAAPVAEVAAAARLDLTAISAIQTVVAESNLSQPEAAKSSSHSAAAPASKSELLQQPLLLVPTAVADVAVAADDSAAQPPKSAVENLPSSNRSTGVLEAASARKDKVCVAEKTYANVLLGENLAAEKSKAYLNPNAPHFLPKTLSPGTSSSVSIKPRFQAIKSAEFPSLPLPNFRIFFSARPQFPQDSLEEPNSPRPSDIFQMFSEGDDVPRLPIPRKKLSVSLRASCQDFNAILKKGRRPESLSFNRKKWKKLAPYSLTDQTSTSNSSPNNDPHFQEQPTANANEEVPEDDSLVAYESNWHSSTSEDDTPNDFDYPLASIDPLMALEYEDFSLSPPRRRKYNKRFRDLPPPLQTRRSQPKD